jgi:two-component system response regulator YesN
MDRSRIEELKRWILKDPGAAGSVKNVADQLGYDPDSLRKAFRGLEGVSLSVFIRDAKILRAVSLAKDSDLRWKEITEVTGLGSRESASRLFKRVTGLSFTEFRRKNRLGRDSAA